jgi:hypothetical protein
LDLRDQLEQLNTDGGNHSQRIVEGLVVGFSPETTEPEVWRFQSGAAEELDPDDAPEHEEPRKGHSVPFVSAQRVNEFDNIPFARTPRESAAGEAVLQDVDYSHALLEAGIEVDDPRFYATYKLGGLDLTTLRRAVLERLKMLIGADPNPFKDSQVGGEWMLVELRAGSAPLVHEVALGPFQADDPW